MYKKNRIKSAKCIMVHMGIKSICDLVQVKWAAREKEI